jgi:HlyD family secretion protein
MAIAFRKKSLEKLSSPEELDAMIQITNRSGWIALLTVGFFLAVAMAWGIYGRVPTKLTGYGILQNPKGLFVVKASSSGQLDALRVELMQEIKKGDVLAMIDQPVESAAVDTADDQLRELEKNYDQLKTGSVSDLARKKREIDQQKAEIKLNIKINQAKIKRLEERIKNRKELQELGLMTQYDVAETIETRETAIDEVAKDNSQLVSLENEYIQAEQDSRNKMQDMKMQISEARDQLAEQQAQLKKDAAIIAPYDGIVVEFGAKQGERVNAGQELFILELVDENAGITFVALQYYPAATAKRIKIGMMTQIAPGSVEVDQYGYLLARVTRIAEFPSTSTGLKEQLVNDELVRQIEQLGVVLEVESILLTDEQTPSGFKWTSSKGPPYSLEVGTTCTTSVIVEEIPPISLVVPLIKEYLLGVGEEQR